MATYMIRAHENLMISGVASYARLIATFWVKAPVSHFKFYKPHEVDEKIMIIINTQLDLEPK